MTEFNLSDKMKERDHKPTEETLLELADLLRELIKVIKNENRI